MATSAELAIIEEKIMNTELGTMSSGYSLQTTQDRKLVAGDNLPAVLGSLPLVLGLGGGLVFGSIISGSILGFAAIPLAVMAFGARGMMKRIQLKNVFKAISEHPSVNSTLVAKVESEPSKVMPQQKIDRYKKVRVFQLGFENNTIVRVFVYWERWNIAIYEFEIFGKHEIDRQLDAWDDTFKSAKAIKD